MKKKIISALLLVVCMCFAFSGCSLEQLAEPEIKYEIENGEASVKKAPNKSTVTQIIIPDEYEGAIVSAINDFSVTNLENVEKISIGKNVKSIGTWAFENNQKLKEFDVSEENEYFCDIDGVLFTKDMKTILFYPPNKDVKTEDVTDDNGNTTQVEYSVYNIPDGVETISTKAFYKCQKLKQVIIPQSVKTIEEKAFFRCSNMENIVLPDNLESIGKDAFSYCTKFTQITIPSMVNRIDTYAFYNCNKLLNIVILAPEDEIALEEKWYPTDNGKKIGELNISYE